MKDHKNRNYLFAIQLNKYLERTHQINHNLIVIYLLMLTIFTFTIISCDNQKVVDNESIPTFQYEFNKSRLSINDKLKLKVRIFTVNAEVRAVDFDKNTINENGFTIEHIEYNVRQTQLVNEEKKIYYNIVFEMGLLVDNIKEFGQTSFPSLEIRLLPIFEGSDDNNIRIFKIPPESIEIVKPSKVNIMLLSFLIAFTIIVTGIIIVFVNTKRKNSHQKITKTNDHELANNIYRRFIKDKEALEKDKNLNKFLSSIERLLTSYVLRKSNVTNIDGFFKLNTISPEVKASVKNLLEDIDKYRGYKALKWHSEELEKLEADFETLLFIL